MPGSDPRARAGKTPPRRVGGLRPAAIGLVLAAALAGCGASESQSAGAGAEAVPAAAAAYLSFESDLDSEQWQQVEDLLGRFPDGGRVLPMLKSSIEEEEEGIDFEDDVEPALGPTVELVWLDFENGGENFVALTQPDDADKLRELASRGDDRAVVGEAEGWSVLAESQALIDRFTTELENGPLAEDEDFQTALAELPGERLATVFVDGQRARAAFDEALAGVPGGSGALGNYGEPVAGAAALAAADDGFGLTAYLRSRGLPPETTAGGALLDDVPAGAFFVVASRSPEVGEGDIPSTPEIEQFERELGISLTELAGLVEGELVVYARPGAVMPELTVLMEPADAEAAKARLDDLVTRVPAERRETTIDGVEATSLGFGRFAILYAAFGGRLVITTLPDGIRSLREDGEKLVDEEAFGSAVEAAGVEGEDVVLYADLEQALRLAEGLAATSGEGSIPPAARRNLEPLGSLVGSVGGEGDVATFELFLEIE